MPLAGWLQLKAPHAEYDSVCSRSAYTALPKRLRDSCCYTEMLGYEPHGMTEIFIKNLRTSLGAGGAAVCIWLQQLLCCGWMKINTSFTVWLFWLLKYKAMSMFSLITIGEHWRMLRATRLKDHVNIQAKLSNIAINNLNPYVLSSPHSFSLFQISCRNPSGSF